MKSSSWYFLVWCIGFSLITTGLSQLQVVGQKEPIIALLGDDVILPCFLRPSTSAVDQTVEWQRRDLTPKEVHYYSDRRDNLDIQNPVYRGRTRLFEEELKKGNMSLKLTGVKHTDNGFFTCFVPKLISTVKTSVIQLIVGAVSQPVISIMGPKDYGVILKCKAEAWRFKPEMTWLDSDGTILPADGPTETETDSEGRYTVRGHVTIQKTDNNRVTCRVQLQQINHKMETDIHVPDGVFPWSRGQKAGLIIGLLVLLAVAVLVGLYMWRKRALSMLETELANVEKELAATVQESETYQNYQLEIKIEKLEKEKEELKRIIDLGATAMMWRMIWQVISPVEQRTLEGELGRLERRLERRERQLADKDKQIADKDKQIADKDKQIADKDLIIEEMRTQMGRAEIKNLSRFSDQQGKTSQNNSGGNQAGLMEMKPLLGPGSKVEDV